MTIQNSLPDHPFGAAPLGRIAFENDLPFWDGVEEWRTIHGEAVTKWLLGHVHSVENVLLPSGVRSSEVVKGAPGTGLWRFKDQDGVWTYGSLDVKKQDVAFVVEEQPGDQKWQSGSLPAQLCASAEACHAVSDDSFAEDLYAALTSGLWKKTGAGKEFVGSWRRCAEVLVAMRGANEPYDVMFGGGCEGYITPDARALLTGLGWEFMGALESQEERHLKALKIVDICESRKITGVPEWYPRWYTAFAPGASDPSSRLNVAAFQGQVQVSDWENFWQLFDIEADW
jgi:hypothetical protein